MTAVSESGYFIALAALSGALVGVVRRVAVARGVIDHPTERGSHALPTPRGGGLGVVTAIAIGGAAIAIPTHDVTALVCLATCLVIAAIGWIDDRCSLPVATRLAVHLAGGIVIGVIASMASDSPSAAAALFVACAFWTISSINFVNFMDGINGFVAAQVLVFSGSLMLFGWAAGNASWYAAAVAAACVGFLPWNFPRARIFLGDAGSGALGFLVPVLVLLAMRDHTVDVVRANLPLLPLFGDAVATLVRRWRRRERLTQPHRSHLYQRIANGGVGHTRVTLLYTGASLLGAIIAHAGGTTGTWPIALAYALSLALLGMLLERRFGTVLPASVELQHQTGSRC